MRVVIEGKLADDPQARKKVQADAQGRIDSGIAQLAVAVVYPAALREQADSGLADELQTAKLDFAVLSEAGPGAWRQGAPIHILNELRRANEAVCKQDVVQQAAQKISRYLDGVAAILENDAATCDRLSQLLGFSLAQKLGEKLTLQRRRTAAKVAALTLANAFIFQEQLSATKAQVRPLRQTLPLDSFIDTTIGHWDWICKTINYVPIFKVAIEILRAIPAGSASGGAIRELARTALEVGQNKAALRHDLMGRIYHLLLHEAKFLGTYYTSVPAATLLMKLALEPARWPDKDFSEARSLGDFLLADLTCGTGTLLMGACQAITDNFVLARAGKKKLDDKRLARLHKVLMEKSIHGYDVLPSAIHLTASALSLVAPEVMFDKLKLFAMPLGVAGRQIKLGSLEFLGSAKTSVQFGLFGEHKPIEEQQIGGRGMKAQSAELPLMDLFVMNPPFVRSVGGNLLFGNLPDAQRKKMQEELKRRVASERLPANITAGLGGVFTALADRYLKLGGRLAFVLPAAFATGEAWGETRALINRDYHLEYVVTSHDPSRWSFSENTDLSELLFVARKLVPGESNAELETVFLSLAYNPANIGDALAIARLTIRDAAAPLGTAGTPIGVRRLAESGQEYGEALAVPMRLMRGAWWGGAFASTLLVRAAWFLHEGSVCVPGHEARGIALAPLSELGEIGPDRRDIHDGFSVTQRPTPYSAFWNHDAERVTSIAAQPNAYLVPHAQALPGRKLKTVESLWPKAGNILVAERLRLTSQRIACLSLPRRVLANTWWVVHLNVDDERAYSALALWLNSTLGVLSMLFARVPTEGPWLQLKKPALAALPVPDIRVLTPEQLNALTDKFERLKDSGLQPFKAMAYDPVRAEIDATIAQAFELPDLTPLREALGNEAIVRGEQPSERRDSEPPALELQTMLAFE